MSSRDTTTLRPLLRVPDVAVYLGQSQAWVRLALADGTIPGARKIRGRWVIARDDVDAWIDAGSPPRPAGEVPQGAYPRSLSRTVGAA